jgi:hypothetical protein
MTAGAILSSWQTKFSRASPGSGPVSKPPPVEQPRINLIVSPLFSLALAWAEVENPALWTGVLKILPRLVDIPSLPRSGN